MREETRHARSVGKLARRFGAEPEEAAGDVLSVRGLLEIAVENAAEGCVRETFGALVAVVQAQAARDPEIARVMRGIARDETRHAQLSWEVAAWAKMKLDGAGRERVDRAMMEAVTKLRRDLETPVCREALAHAGFPAPTQAIALFERLAQQIWKKN